MKYTIEDLDYIFIRAQRPDGGWDSLTLNEVSNEQFTDWAKDRFGIGMERTPIRWTPEQKVSLLNEISKSCGRPCVVMIKHGQREALDEIKRRSKSEKD